MSPLVFAIMSWLDDLVSKAFAREKYYKAALQAICVGDQANLEHLLQQNPPLIRASYCMSGSLLHNAAMDGQVDITKMLIDNGADVNSASTRDNETPLHFAAETGKLETIKVLIERGANIDALCYQLTHSPLDRAVWSSRGAHKDVIRYLVTNGAKHSSIHVTAVLGDIEGVEEALKAGCDVNSRILSGDTPMYWAVQGGDTANTMIDFLISHGADVEGGASIESATPLYIAVANGNLTAVEVLLEHGANPNAEGAIGWKPLFVAQTHNYNEIARLLLESGADECSQRLQHDVSSLRRDRK